MNTVFRSRLLWAALVVAALVGAYALFGFYGVPRLIRSQAIAFVQQEYGRTLAIGEVRFQPFKLQLEVRDVALPDTDGKTMLGFERLFVDFSIESVWRRALVFAAIAIDRPTLRAVIRRDGSMNLADLAPKEPSDEPLPSIWIRRFDVRRGLIDYLDLARRVTYERRFEPVEFELDDFRTTPDGGHFTLSAESRDQERFALEGRFALEPEIASSGEITIEDLRLVHVAEFLGDALPFGLSRGLVDLGASYRVVLGRTTELGLKLPTIAVTDLGLRARGVDEDWITIPSIAISDTVVDMPANTVAIDRVGVSGLAGKAWIDAAGELSLLRLFESGPAAAPAATPAAADPAVAAPEAEWQVRIGAVALTDSRFELQDRWIAPDTDFVFAPLDVELRDLSLDLGRPIPLTLTARVNDRADLKLGGTITPEPLAAKLDVDLGSARMQILQPYILPLADITIRGGTMQTQGSLTLAPPGSGEPEVAFDGNVTMTGFDSIDNTLEEPFIRFESVELRKLRYTMAPDLLSIDSVGVRRPYARVVISEDQVLNIAAALDPQGTAQALAERKASQAAGAATAKKTFRKQTREERAAAARAAEEAKAAQKAAAKARAAAAEAAPALVETGMPIRVREVRIDGGEMNFADFYVRPNFQAKIERLSGSLHGLSTDPNARAKLKLEGRTGEFSPVTIGGEIQPFAFDRYTDVKMRFENISLPVFNPYASPLAGYNIAKGKLTTDLAYLIRNRKLDAQHHIRIDQLEWGEATPERAEAPLPVRFATSLLKDKDGVIDLDIPVTGTLDDPQFRIGPIVWKIVKNLIVKAVSAPFKFLGSLFKGAEDAQFIEFAPGLATLDPAAAEHLAVLGKGLVEKPELKLDVPIGTVADLDGAALREQAYAKQLEAATRSVTGTAAGAAVPAFDSLSGEQKVAVLTAVVQQATGAPPAPPPPLAVPEGTERKEAARLQQAATLEFLEQEARAKVTVPEAELEQLGVHRAEAIQSALLTGTGLDPQRVFLARSDKVGAVDGKVRFELGLK